VDDLVQWLGQQLDEDERIARAARPRPGDQTAGEWVAYPHRPTSPTDDPSRNVHLVGSREPDGREWVVAETGQADRAPTVAEFIAAHDPARVLREIDAKRKIIAEHDVYSRPLGERMDCQSYDFPCTTLRLLALPYADRPGYREEWRP
jgi:hypothetical protein